MKKACPHGGYAVLYTVFYPYYQDKIEPFTCVGGKSCFKAVKPFNVR